MRTGSNGHDDGNCNGNGECDGESPLSEQDGEITTADDTDRCSVDMDEMSDNFFNTTVTEKYANGNSANVRLDNGAHTTDSNEQKGKEDKTAPPSHNKKKRAPEPPTSSGGGEVKLRDRRRRESAPAIGTESAQVRGGRRISRGSQRALLCSGLSEDSAWEGLELGDGSTPKGSRRNFIELMMSSSPQVRRSMINRGSRLRDSVRSDSDSGSLLSSSADEDCASVTLDPLEHEWMLCASDGQWDSLHPLLVLEPGLVSKRDFVTGFTCLHWAAKLGDAELLSRLVAFARDSQVTLDVNVRSSAGYTPLHLAAMHGHTQVVRMLLSDWEADPEARDYSGRRAIQYLPPGLAAELQEVGVVSSPPADTEDADVSSVGRWRLPRVLQSNLNPLRLLSPQAEGAGVGRSKGVLRKSSLSRLNARLHGGRCRTIIHSISFRESGEMGRGHEPPVSPLKARPLSNLFG
ncbi:ankyrin repeat domain-containing protein SOWAHC [Aplochiton taeniatus]